MKPQPYGPFPYLPMPTRPKMTWPNGARVALWVIPNVEFFSLEESVPAGSGGSGNKAPDVMQWAARDYGNRVGIFRIMDVLDRHNIRATVALNSDLCAQHPYIIEQGCKRNWEWMGHNQTNTRRLSDAGPAGEEALIAGTLSTIAAATGTRPVGWLSSGLQETWDSLELLATHGVRYVADWINDDQPYMMQLPEGKTIASVPYSGEINDKPAYEKLHRTGPEFGDMIRRQFDVLYREGEHSARVMAIALHPYLSGVPHRIDALDAALNYICAHENVWLATGSEIAATLG
jgi:allantoinase